MFKESCLRLCALFVLVGFGAAAAQVPAPGGLGASPATQLDQFLLQNPRAFENYRLDLERTNQMWETFRQQLELSRSRQSVPTEEYLRLLDAYKNGITAYRAGIENYRTIARAFGTGSADPATSAIDTLYSSKAIHAEAVTELTIADALLRSEPPDRINMSARSALLQSFAEPQFDAVRAYIQDRFPAPDGSAVQYAVRIKDFVAGLVQRARRVAAPLRIASTPRGARVSLHPKYSKMRVRIGTTDMEVPNLYVGLYLIQVSLPGHRPYEEELDWLDDDQPLLICTLTSQDIDGTSSCLRRR